MTGDPPLINRDWVTSTITADRFGQAVTIREEDIVCGSGVLFLGGGGMVFGESLSDSHRDPYIGQLRISKADILNMLGFFSSPVSVYNILCDGDDVVLTLSSKDKLNAVGDNQVASFPERKPPDMTFYGGNFADPIVISPAVGQEQSI